MSQHSDEGSAFSIRTAELAVAGFFFLLGAIVVFDSVRLGAKWAADGPQPIKCRLSFLNPLMVMKSSCLNCATRIFC